MSGAPKAPIPFPLPEDLAGSRVGRFVVHSKLGKGGMGEVYYAEDTQLRRPVALKRVARRLGNDPDARRHILHEAQRASGLNSEHIASIHDVLETNGELFIVMEYVEGETLRQRLLRPLTLEQFFDVATQCAEALIAAHEHSIVHCDIKPENIVLTPVGKVKVLDFGVAKHLPTSDRSSTLDASGPVGGTPGYMAPEVLLEQWPDARSDIFSLGVVFYEMLALRHPFFAGSFVATSERVLHEEPAAIRTLNPKIPEGVAAVVMKAMAKDPRQRYASARELLDDLRIVKAGGVSSKATPAPWLRAKTGRKRWLVAALAAACFLAAILGVYRWTHHAPILAERGWVLIADFENAGDGTIPDKGVREGLTIALQQSRYVNVFPRSRAYEVLHRMKKQDKAQIDETLGREICQRENLQLLLAGSIERMGEVYQITVRALDPVRGDLLFAERERFDRKDQFFEKADTLAKRVRQNLGESLIGIEKSSRPLARVTTSSLEALQLYSQAKDAKVQGNDEQVPTLLKGALRLDPDFAMAHMLLGQDYLAVVGKNQKAAAELGRAYELRQGVTDREQRRIEAQYYDLYEQYDDKAQSLSVLVSLYPDDEEAHQELASAHYDLNQLDKAVFDIHEVLRINPHSAPAYRSLVLYLARANRAEDAVAATRQAQQSGADSPRMYWGLGLAYLGQGDVSVARQQFQRLSQGTDVDRDLQELCSAVADLYEGKLNAAKAELAGQIQAVPPRSGGLQLFRRYLLGRIHASHGDLQAAEMQADLMLDLPSIALQTSDLLHAGIVYARAGKLAKARRVLRQIDDSRKAFPSSWNDSSFHNMEGEIALADGKLEQAEIAFATAVQVYSNVLSPLGLGLAHQSQRRWDVSAREFEKVISRRGEILQNEYPPDLVIAHLQLARAYRQMHRPDAARAHYEQILHMWEHADDLPVLREARRESQETSAEVGHSRTTLPPARSAPEKN